MGNGSVSAQMEEEAAATSLAPTVQRRDVTSAPNIQRRDVGGCTSPNSYYYTRGYVSSLYSSSALELASIRSPKMKSNALMKCIGDGRRAHCHTSLLRGVIRLSQPL